jgi:hypothetical protein
LAEVASSTLTELGIDPAGFTGGGAGLTGGVTFQALLNAIA